MDLVEPSRIEELLLFLESAARTHQELGPAWEEERRRFQALARSGTGGPSLRAELRFREYFLLEHRSARYGVVPAMTLLDEFAQRLESDSIELGEILLASHVDVFEVVSAPQETRPGIAVGEECGGALRAELCDPGFEDGLLAGDLVAGRFYPRSSSALLVSPGAAVIRDARLARALLRDIAQMRAHSPHLRFSQLEFESLFFQGEGRDRASPEETVAALQAFLAGANLEGLTIESLAAHKRASRNSSEFVSGLLEQLAFETSCDLDQARELLLAYWTLDSTSASVVPKGERGGRASQHERRQAVDAFERGRVQGRDLGALFEELEQALGLEREEGDGEACSEGRFQPERIGITPIVEEYIWERTRLGQPLGGASIEHLQDLGRYLDQHSPGIDSIDNLQADELGGYLLVRMPEWIESSGRDTGEALERVVARSWDDLDELASWLDSEQGTSILARLRELRLLLESEHQRLLNIRSRRAALRHAGEPELATLWVRVLEAPSEEDPALVVEALGRPKNSRGQESASLRGARNCGLERGDLAHIEVAMVAEQPRLAGVLLAYSAETESLLGRSQVI